MNCSEMRRVTSSLFIHRLFAFCRHSPQLILRLYYVSSRPSAVGKLRRTVADQPGVDWFGQHLGVCRYQSDARPISSGLHVDQLVHAGWLTPPLWIGRGSYIRSTFTRPTSS